MKIGAILTKREREVTELMAWGAAKKEVADMLGISTRTVENTARKIYEKINIQKATELSVWWFCTHCGVSFDLSPIKRKLIAVALLLIIIPQLTFVEKDIQLPKRRARISCQSCRNENDDLN
jgi:DNA-binding CsgD family transcriptional regulator